MTRVALAVALSLVTTGVSHADDTPARPLAPRRAATLRQRGLEHFVNREYQLAADDLMEAYRLDKREVTLFGWAEAVRATGDCELATRIYQRLLRKTSTLKLARQAELGIAACEAAAQGEPVVAPAVALGPEPAFTEVVPRRIDLDPAVELPADADATATATAAPEPAPSRPAPPVASLTEPNLHLTSYLVIGGGSILALAGLATYATASDGTGDPNATHAEVTSARSDGDWRRLIGASLAVIGGGVTFVGVLQYRKENRARPVDRALTIRPWSSSTGSGLAVSGRF